MNPQEMDKDDEANDNKESKCEDNANIMKQKRKMKKKKKIIMMRIQMDSKMNQKN